MERRKAYERTSDDADNEHPQENTKKRESIGGRKVAYDELKSSEKSKEEKKRSPREEGDECHQPLIAEFEEESHAALVDAEEDKTQYEEGAREYQQCTDTDEYGAQYKIHSGMHRDTTRMDFFKHLFLNIILLQHIFLALRARDADGCRRSQPAHGARRQFLDS